mmetsp:Transcript_70795/g.200558  ORF Transcript_70795/g.200558 Transcript_70795/m.200558 type:complete len:204 (+) Transcript_70795:1623-2234(+)
MGWPRCCGACTTTASRLCSCPWLLPPGVKAFVPGSTPKLQRLKARHLSTRCPSTRWPSMKTRVPSPGQHSAVQLAALSRRWRPRPTLMRPGRALVARRRRRRRRRRCRRCCAAAQVVDPATPVLLWLRPGRLPGFKAYPAVVRVGRPRRSKSRARRWRCRGRWRRPRRRWRGGRRRCRSRARRRGTAQLPICAAPVLLLWGPG